MFTLANWWGRLPVIATHVAGQSRILQRYQNQISRSYSILSLLPASCPRVLFPPAMKPCAESAGGVTTELVRTNVRKHYKPNVHKRLKKHGLKKRLSSRNGLKMLWRRYLKGVWSLST